MIGRRKNAGRRGAIDRVPVDRILPPEGVPLTLRVAGIGVRLGAQITDVLLTVAGAVAAFILVTALGVVGPEGAFAIAMLLFFAIRVPYYVLAELIWNGQTLGKRMMKIKVVSHDGGPLTTHAIVLRNLMKEAEVFLPMTLILMLDGEAPVEALLGLAWILICLLVPLMNRYRMRLGDLMAGTHVIHLPVPILLKDLAVARLPGSANEERFTFLPHQLDHYGAFELQTLETLLRVETGANGPWDAGANGATKAAIVERIRRKIGYSNPVAPADHGAFLWAFYNAQRQHLEQRQLFGDRREDKHFAEQEADR